MRVYRRRRVFTIIVFLAVSGLIFLGFQVLSVHILSLDTARHQLNADKSAKIILTDASIKQRKSLFKDRLDKVRKSHRYSKPDNSNRTKVERKAQQNAIASLIANLRKEDATETITPAGRMEHKAFEEDELDKRVESALQLIRNRVIKNGEKGPHGVSPELHKYYKPDTAGRFRCLNSNEEMSFERVNDDYCDCKDGTDEPGTSACNNGRFYCTFQVDPYHLVWISASKVNDAICDCCDGSDESKPHELPPHVALHGGKLHYGIYQWPCKDYCTLLMRDHVLHEVMNKQGAAIRRQYIEESRGKENPDFIYGKEGEFLPLSTNCFLATSGKYDYEVCPFMEVRQRYQGTVRIIGKNHAVWVKQDPAVGFRLNMMNGDSSQCPMLKSRLTWVDFICGVDNKVLSVQETEICEYTVKFETPATCQDISE